MSWLHNYLAEEIILLWKVGQLKVIAYRNWKVTSRRGPSVLDRSRKESSGWCWPRCSSRSSRPCSSLPEHSTSGSSTRTYRQNTFVCVALCYFTLGSNFVACSAYWSRWRPRLQFCFSVLTLNKFLLKFFWEVAGIEPSLSSFQAYPANPKTTTTALYDGLAYTLGPYLPILIVLASGAHVSS